MVDSSSPVTLTHAQRGPRGGQAFQPLLFLALQSDQPREGSARYALGGVDTVVIGRRSERQVEWKRAGHEVTMLLGVNDRFLSSTHARFTRIMNRWMLEDGGSKNGCFVNGARVERGQLSDGDLLELGRSFFVFRDATSGADSTTTDLDSRALASQAFGLRTLLPGLGAELARLQEIARSEVPVLVHGETGTGKELVARGVHALSGRRGPLVAVNCGALPQTLFLAELFGHKKGAFTGADEERQGWVRSADQGTLFLDEVGDLPLEAQPAFLRVLQEREVVPVGSTRPLEVNVRLVSATHRDLSELAAKDQFRNDLLARLSGFSVRLPPLRERKAELGLLIADLLERALAERAEEVSFSVDAARALMFHDWPLNVRELEKCLSAACVLAADRPIDLEHLPEAVQSALDRMPGGDAAEADDRPLSPEDERRKAELIVLLGEHGGNVSEVARQLGKARMQVQRWLKRFRLDPQNFRR